MPDKYDEAVKYLTARPWKIFEAWEAPNTHHSGAGCLFNYAGDRREGCGCLTEIRSGAAAADTASLTREIMNDGRIPSDPMQITPADLPVFAEWQRRLDKELKRP